ncbi:ferredoxin reductase-like protein [Amylocystis lapponica]|nr:ferredoxin reductase-like protein [Amylocystis lapponica]
MRPSPTVRYASHAIRIISLQTKCAHPGLQFRRAMSNQPASPAPKPYASRLVGGCIGAASVLTAAYLFLPDESRSSPTRPNASLSPAHFTPVTLAASEPCTDPDARLITLVVPAQAVPARNESLFAPVWSIFVKDDDIQVERPYTPLEGIDSEGRMKFWIKRYPKGEVARWLHSKNVGDKIEIRGPLKTWPWQEGVWDEVVMISGGTGITPFYQLLHHSVLQGPSSPARTRFTLLHSSHTPDELPPPAMLEPLLAAAEGHPERLKLALHVDSLNGPMPPCLRASDLQVGRIGKAAIEHALGSDDGSGRWWQYLRRKAMHRQEPDSPNRKVLFLICGPQPMIDAIAGPFGRNYSQGAVGGILGGMGYDTDQVYKL